MSVQLPEEIGPKERILIISSMLYICYRYFPSRKGGLLHQLLTEN